MKRRRPPLALTDGQQLFLGLLLVILVAVSMLYCVGLGSLLLREAWEGASPNWAETVIPFEVLPLTPDLVTPPATETAAPPP